jgi:polysaccharide biosynthesis protein PslG
VDLAEGYGVRIIARLDHTPAWARPPGSTPGTPPSDPNDYAKFVAEFVRHYRGRVQYVQIWNEPNLAVEWGGQIDPDGYFRLLQAAYARAKEVDPNVVILSAPMAMTNEHSDHAIPEFDYWGSASIPWVPGNISTS